MIVDDAPAFGKFLKDEREEAAGIAGGGVEAPFADDERSGVAEGTDFKDVEGEMAHGGFVGIAGFVMVEDGRPAAGEAGRTGEGDIGRVPVAGHEGGDVAAIPGLLLLIENREDGGTSGIGGSGRGGLGEGRTCQGEGENGEGRKAVKPLKRHRFSLGEGLEGRIGEEGTKRKGRMEREGRIRVT